MADLSLSCIKYTHLECKRILSAQLHILLLVRYIGFGSFGGLGRRTLCRGSRGEVEKMGEGEGKEKEKHQYPFTQLGRERYCESYVSCPRP